MDADHPVFTRFTRQQMIIKRRHIGFQTLVFNTSLPKETRCKLCKRQFTSIWKSYLCHVCGFWNCEPCSSVIERERETLRVQYIRTCFECLSMLNKWSGADVLLEYAHSPWIVQDSKRQISLNLSDIFHKDKSQRRAALVILKRLGMCVDVDTTVLDEISEDDWIVATTHDTSTTQSTSLLMGTGNTTVDDDIRQTFISRPPIEKAQYLVQQCFEIKIHELGLEECKFAESDGTRRYQIEYNLTEGIAHPDALIMNEDEREECVKRYGLVTSKVLKEEMNLICHLASKELDSSIAGIYVVEGNQLIFIATNSGRDGIIFDRHATYANFSLTSTLPFFVRNAILDIRFRDFDIVRGASNRFYIGFPIFSDTGKVMAILNVLDPAPRKHITTMQYSVLKVLSEMVTSLWNDELKKK